MRAATLSLLFVVGAGLVVVAVWGVGAHAGPVSRPAGDAIVSTARSAATAARLDGSSRVELPWLGPGDTGATLSPDGYHVAFSSARSGSTEIYVADARTGKVTRLTGNAEADDVHPAWSPDGRQLAWASGRPGAFDLFAMGADGARKRRLVAGEGDDTEPAWSPDGTTLAFASNRDGRYRIWLAPTGGGAEPAPLADVAGQMRSPAWSPSGARVAYTGSVAGSADVWVVGRDGAEPTRLTTAAGFDGRPAWSPDGRLIAFVSNRASGQRLWVMRADGSRQRVLAGSGAGDDDPGWGPADASVLPERGTLLPDLDQQAPSGLVVMRTGGRVKLGFTSAVDNIGDGPIHIRGTRFGSQRTMRADQLVHRRRGAPYVVVGVGRLAYEAHPPHHHWHLAPYERYELLLAADGSFIGRDGKSGFCLLDRWGRALRRPGLTVGPPRFVGDCAALQPEARRVDQGSSVGYTDRYPGFFHGQDIDITGLEPGLYVLVHRANPKRLIRELRYSNNDASVLIRVSPPSRLTGAPSVEIVRRCPASDRCPAS